jgi:hypothetical protein
MDIPFTRFTAPRGDPNEAWLGFATITDAEVKDLAKKIVDEVKTRGPFFSLGDFINRDPHRAADNFATRGTLQKAIDNTTINADIGIGSAPSMTETPNAGLGIFSIYPENLASSTAANMPGWLAQNDIVRLLAPIMTARGDTFIIRCYGDAKNPVNGDINSRAYAEALVQRLPDFLDPSDAAHAALTDLTQPENSTFGRRFKIVAFRWLDDV